MKLLSCKQDGEHCCRNRDCLSGHCNSFLLCGKRKINEPCKTDKDCHKSKCINEVCYKDIIIELHEKTNYTTKTIPMQR